MAKREERKLLIGLDIGTSKVVAIVGELSSENTLEVIGIGSVDNCPFAGFQMPGYLQGNSVIIKVYRPSTGELFDTYAEYSAGTGTFGDLFMAGAVPGLMLATFYGLFTLARCYINPSLAPTAEEVEKARGKEMKLSKEKYLFQDQKSLGDCLGTIELLLEGVARLAAQEKDL